MNSYKSAFPASSPLSQAGMDLLTYIAAKNMAALYAAGEHHTYEHADIADDAVNGAVALIKALKNRELNEV